ncbi:MAG: hypothetical protein P8X64_10040 [Anaerolineales bacterium]
MRGKRVTPASHKLDVVLVSARYQSDKPQLEFAQGYVRHGFVWSDLKLLRRSEIIHQIAAGKKVSTGKPVEMPGNFEAGERIELVRQDGDQRLRAGSASGPGDNLNLPLV